MESDKGIIRKKKGNIIEYNLQTITFKKGSHKNREIGMCLMEAVAYISGENHTDHPECADPVITSIAITLNDSIESDEERKKLLSEFLWRIPGTKSEKFMYKRIELFAQFLISLQRDRLLLKNSSYNVAGTFFYMDSSVYWSSIFSHMNVLKDKMVYNKSTFNTFIKYPLIKLLDELISMTEIKEQKCQEKKPIHLMSDAD